MKIFHLKKMDEALQVHALKHEEVAAKVGATEENAREAQAELVRCQAHVKELTFTNTSLFGKQQELPEALKLKDLIIVVVSEDMGRLENQPRELKAAIPQMKKDVRDQTVKRLHGKLAKARERTYEAMYRDTQGEQDSTPHV